MRILIRNIFREENLVFPSSFDILILYYYFFFMTQNKVLVELLTYVQGLGKPGDRVSVSSAQARNALIPKKQAKILDEKTIESMNQKAKRQELERQMLVEKRHEYQEKLHGKELKFELRWDHDKVYGSITEHEIIEKIKKEYSIALEKGDVHLPNKAPIKKIGNHQVQIHLGFDSYARLSVEVASTGKNLK